MAASAIPAPGTEYGPCLECEHLGCKANREIAACKCRFCGNEIGYNNRAFDEWYDQQNPTGRYDYFVHELCYLLSIEREDNSQHS